MGAATAQSGNALPKLSAFYAVLRECEYSELKVTGEIEFMPLSACKGRDFYDRGGGVFRLWYQLDGEHERVVIATARLFYDDLVGRFDE